MRSPNSRRRSGHALLIDRAIKARKVFPNTPQGRSDYSKHKGYADLKGFDDSRTQSDISNNWERRKTRSFLFEDKSGDVSDHLDMSALEDSTLTARENKENLRRQFKDMVRLF